MKHLWLVAVLLAVNGLALIGGRRMLREERQLVAERDRLESERVNRASAMASQQALSELVETARRESVRAPDSMASLRSVLVTAEEGLSLRRGSLELRQLEGSRRTSYAGARARLSLSGPYWQLVEYLRRLDKLQMPLSLVDLSLTGDGDGESELTSSWLALWPDAGTPDRRLSDEDLSSLKAWFSRAERARHNRNLFRLGYDEPAPVTPPLPDPVETPESLDPPAEAEPPEIEVPVLTGFVWARPEQQPDPQKRVAAQLRYQGEGALVHRGDRVGEFRVERIDAPDTVTLVNVETGEEVILHLE